MTFLDFGFRADVWITVFCLQWIREKVIKNRSVSLKQSVNGIILFPRKKFAIIVPYQVHLLKNLSYAWARFIALNML